MNMDSKVDLQNLFNKGGYQDLEAMTDLNVESPKKKRNWKIPTVLTLAGLSLLGGFACYNNSQNHDSNSIDSAYNQMIDSSNYNVEMDSFFQDVVVDEIVETIADTGIYVASKISEFVPESSAEIYTVQSGDFLEKIARNYIADNNLDLSLSAAVADIASDNNLTNPDRIYPGQELTIDFSNLSGFETEDIEEVDSYYIDWDRYDISEYGKEFNSWELQGTFGGTTYEIVEDSLRAIDQEFTLKELLDITSSRFDVRDELLLYQTGQDSVETFADSISVADNIYQAPELMERTFENVDEDLETNFRVQFDDLSNLTEELLSEESGWDDFSEAKQDSLINYITTEDDRLELDLNGYTQVIDIFDGGQETEFTEQITQQIRMPELVEYNFQRVEFPQINWFERYEFDMNLQEFNVITDTLRQEFVSDSSFVEELIQYEELNGGQEIRPEVYSTKPTQTTTAESLDFSGIHRPVEVNSGLESAIQSDTSYVSTPEVSAQITPEDILVVEEQEILGEDYSTTPTQTTISSSLDPSEINRPEVVHNLDEVIQSNTSYVSTSSEIPPTQSQNPVREEVIIDPAIDWIYSSANSMLPRLAYNSEEQGIDLMLENLSGDYTMLILDSNGSLLAHRYFDSIEGDLRINGLDNIEVDLTTIDGDSDYFNSSAFYALSPREQSEIRSLTNQKITLSANEVRFVEGTCEIGDDGSIYTSEYDYDGVLKIDVGLEYNID